PEAPAPARRPLTPRPALDAARRIAPILDRAKLINLSAARVLDERGCVIASTGSQLGECLYHLPEVSAALKGRYSAVARHRYSDEPPPPVTSISRRGHLRVFTAMPVLRDGAVIGVVRMSRTALSPLEALWEHRRALLWALIASLLFTGALTLWLSRVIARPVREITRAAQAVAKGARRRPLPEGRVFAEVYDLSAALDEMTHLLQERAAYIAEFAANASHELKTPIAGIKGAVELLRDMGEGMDEAQRRRFLDNINAGAERMERLVRRLLRLARIEHGAAPEAPLIWRPVVEALADDPRITLTIAADLPPKLPIHAEHLEDALSNLITNALKAGPPVIVEVEARRATGGVLFRVRDHGPGISEKNRARIFDRFFTTRRDDGGTGLGLSIVRAIARLYDGEITFISGPSGSTFTLVLNPSPSEGEART
ncbi:HAMP domain-containing protein, partial [Myxococcota bacterium]|nr:HAMP domain-containing protein [Myxococcota bacterium]